MRRLRVARTAAAASGAITPMTGTASEAWSAGSAAEVAALQATTISFTPCALEVARRSRARSGAISASGRGPYGQPRVVAEVDEVLVRHRHEALVQDGQPARRPESKTPIGRASMRGDSTVADLLPMPGRGWRPPSGSAPARSPTTRSSSTGTRGACRRASGSPATRSASRRSRSTRPSTACPTSRWCRAGPTGRRPGSRCTSRPSG